jgi:hypothetical protein
LFFFKAAHQASVMSITVHKTTHHKAQPQPFICPFRQYHNDQRLARRPQHIIMAAGKAVAESSKLSSRVGAQRKIHAELSPLQDTPNIPLAHKPNQCAKESCSHAQLLVLGTLLQLPSIVYYTCSP